MRNSIFFLILLIVFSSFYSIGKNEADVISYSIVMKLDTVARKLEVQNVINIENSGSSKICTFLFWNNIKINNAQLNGKNLDYKFDNDTLSVNIGSAKKIKLTLNYTIPIDSLITFHKYGIIALTRGNWWCPFISDDISALHSKITVPGGFIVYSSGELINYSETANGNYFEYYNFINSGLPIIIAPENYYKQVSKKQDNISIKYYFHNPDHALTNSIIDESLATIHFCVNYIGNYNRSQLTYIEYPGFPSAQALETFVMMGSDFIKYYPQMKYWVAHETIHEWMGAGYFNAMSKSNKYGRFIEESLTEYMRYLYLEKTFGQDSLAGQIKHMINVFNNEIKGTDQDVPILVNLPNRVTYCVGPLIFHVVRKEMGEENWHNFIKSLYSKYYGKMIDYNDFRKELSIFTNQSVISKMEKSIESKGIPIEITGY
jgi:hypothetical protein